MNHDFICGNPKRATSFVSPISPHHLRSLESPHLKRSMSTYRLHFFEPIFGSSIQFLLRERSFLRQKAKQKMSNMPFHLQAAPASSHRPSMADCRLPAISVPPPGPHPHTIPNCRVLPPLTLPPISHLNPPPVVNYPPTNYSHRYLIPSTPGPQVGSNAQAPPSHAHGAAGFQGAGSTSNHPASSALAWNERHLKDLEVLSRNDSGEEKGKAFLGVWLGIREIGLRDKESVRRFIAKKLMPYHWFKGDETIGEALRALNRLEFINIGLIAKKHTENAMWYWSQRIGDMSVREYWMEEGRKQRQKAQARAQAQAQAQAQR
jgi:hypothetical protein